MIKINRKTHTISNVSMTSYEVSLITSMFVEKENMIDLDAMRYARVDDHCQIFVFAWTLSVARFLKTKKLTLASGTTHADHRRLGSNKPT